MTEKRVSASRTQSDPDEIPVSQLSYTQASSELDEIVEFFEHRDVDVDQLVARLERATSIVDELDRRVRRTRSQVEQLVPRLQGTARGVGSEQSDMDELEEEEDEAEEMESSNNLDSSLSVEPELFS
jgi:exonuclease VII small subunit